MKTRACNQYVWPAILSMLFLMACQDAGKDLRRIFNTNKEDSDSEIRNVYYEDGKTLMQSISYKNGKKNGEAREYYRTGIIKARQVYVDDELKDSSINFHDNGQIHSLQVYNSAGQRTGCWKEFNKNGRLYSEINYFNGLLDGVSTTYTYLSGKIQERISYKNGRKNGPEEFYYPNGNPKSKANYDMDLPCSGLQEWLENGEPVNNDFKIIITEKNQLLLTGEYKYIIRLSDPKPDDVLYRTVASSGDCRIEYLQRIWPAGDGYFEYAVNIPRGGSYMDKLCLAALRKTAFGNTYIKLYCFNAAIDNY